APHYYFVNSIYYHLISHFFFLNDTATTQLYTLSLHDALPIYQILDNMADANRALHLERLRKALAAIPGIRAGKERAHDPSFESRSEEHTSELQSRRDLVCRLLLEKKKGSRVTLLETPTISTLV